MPELPDITVYIEALEQRIVGETIERVRIRAPFLLRTFEPPIDRVESRTVTRLRRLGKRIAIGTEGDLWLVIHLMIAGRLHWKPAGAGIPAKRGLAAFDFSSGTLLLTEEGTQKRASLHVIDGSLHLQAHDPGGIDVFRAELAEFRSVLQSESHTVKRALTDPRLFSGIGNAYSDEILHRARLSPLKLTGRLDEGEIERLYHAVRETLGEWTDRLRGETGTGFPKRVTAFREEMAVHGKFGEPCPKCAAPIQRIRYASNETNYCPGCQTGGKILADRSLSRLLKDDWPRSLDELGNE